MAEEGDNEIIFNNQVNGGHIADMNELGDEGSEGHESQDEFEDASEEGVELGAGDMVNGSPAGRLGRAAVLKAPVKPRMVMKPEKYDGKGDWAEYLCHFEDCADLSGWDNRSKCLILATSLQDGARKYYAGLKPAEKGSYTRLVSALQRRYGNEHKQESWASKLEMRKRKPGESISDLCDDIWAMTQRAYHDFDVRSQEQLALKHLYRLIDTDMKVKCIENKCKTLADAVDVVERYEALYEDTKDKRKAAARSIGTTSSMEPVMAALSMIADKLESMDSKKKEHKKKWSGPLICYNCQEEGHFARDCPNGSVTTNQNSRFSKQGNANPSN